MFKIDVVPTKSTIKGSNFPHVSSLQSIQGQVVNTANNSCCDEEINDDETTMVKYAEQVVPMGFNCIHIDPKETELLNHLIYSPQWTPNRKD